MNPFGGIAFEQLHRLGERQRGGQAEKNMNVIGNSADCHGYHSIFARDAAKIGPKPFANFAFQQRLTHFGREHAMVERTGEGMNSAVPVGTVAFCIPDSQR
jgi:hypothetical protein